MLVILTGKPGLGKTLTLTHIAYKNFKKKNPTLKVFFTEKILRKTYIYDLSEYSDYPIVFKRPKKGRKYHYKDEEGNVISTDCLCSLQWRIFDLILSNKFLDGANFYCDEIQTKYDSMEYKDFPDCIAHYCQCHRHFDNNIYISSQSQSRIIKRILVLAEEYWNIISFRKIFGFALLTIARSWEKSASLEDNLSSYLGNDVEYFRALVPIKRIGQMYDSKYLRNLQNNSIKYKSAPYSSLQLSKEALLNSFFPSNEEKEFLNKLRF